MAFVVALLGAASLTMLRLLAAPVGLAALDVAYTQNFNTLASAGSSSTLPEGWELLETGTSGSVNGAYSAGTGSGNAGDMYSFGAAASAERALGGLLSGTLTPTFGASFINNTSGTITSLDVAYVGEQWRLGATGRTDRLDFQYSTNATSLATGTWTDVNALDFNGPISSGTLGALDGNSAANRAAVGGTISALNIPVGATVWIRWSDSNATGADDGLAVDDFSLTPHGLPAGDTAPSVTAVTPADGATGVLLTDNITVTFSEAVTLTEPWFNLVCTSSGAHTATVTGGATSFTLNPTTDFVYGEQCTLVITAANVADQDLLDPPDTMLADVTTVFATSAADPCALPFTPIYQIQGSGATAAITGVVSTKGVVVGDYEFPGSGSSVATDDSLDGFYIQDPTGDGNTATSDGIFVFTGSNNRVNLGDVVRVTGTAVEFQGQTQLSSVTAVQACGTGTVAPVDVTFPVPSATFLEQHEGMLVRLPQTMVVTEHFQLGRFGQVVLSSNARLQQPTNVTTPGINALALQASNNLNKIILDDASQFQNPDPVAFGRGGQPLSASNTLRGGDSAAGIVGVMTFTWAGNAASGNAYRLRPFNALGGGSVNFLPTNPRPGSSPVVGGSVRVVGMNLLNFFNTFADGNAGTPGCYPSGADSDCRGANSAAEFTRQYQKTVAAILALNPDVAGVNELENDGYGAASALRFLVDQLNAATAPGTYAFIDVDAATGQTNAMGTDAIRVALLYKPLKVTPVGQTAVLNSADFVNAGDGFPRNRPSLAQAFRVNATDAVFIVDVNHLKSKGSACDLPDAGDGQGNCNQVRVAAAATLMNWLASDPTATGDPDILLVGDYNSYAMEDPITRIKNAGFTNLVESFLGPDAYSYVFDGQWGYLDQALGSASLVPQVTGVADFHINADEPSVLDYNTEFKTPGQVSSFFAPDAFRVSDHDPVIIGLNPPAPFVFTYGGFALNRATGRWVQNVTIRNNSSTTATGPISFVLAALSSNATLYASTGTTAAFYPGSPYKNLSLASLAPGASASITLEFTKTGAAAITYVGHAAAGAGPR